MSSGPAWLHSEFQFQTELHSETLSQNKEQGENYKTIKKPSCHILSLSLPLLISRYDFPKWDQFMEQFLNEKFSTGSIPNVSLPNLSVRWPPNKPLLPRCKPYGMSVTGAGGREHFFCLCQPRDPTGIRFTFFPFRTVLTDAIWEPGRT